MTNSELTQLVIYFINCFNSFDDEKARSPKNSAKIATGSQREYSPIRWPAAERHRTLQIGQIAQHVLLFCLPIRCSQAPRPQQAGLRHLGQELHLVDSCCHQRSRRRQNFPIEELQPLESASQRLPLHAKFGAQAHPARAFFFRPSSQAAPQRLDFVIKHDRLHCGAVLTDQRPKGYQ